MSENNNFYDIAKEAIEKHVEPFIRKAVNKAVEGKEDIWWDEVIKDPNLNVTNNNSPTLIKEHVGTDYMDLQCCLKFLYYDNRGARTVNARNLVTNGTLDHLEWKKFTKQVQFIIGVRNEIYAHKTPNVVNRYQKDDLEYTLSAFTLLMEQFKEVDGFEEDYVKMKAYRDRYKNYKSPEDKKVRDEPVTKVVKTDNGSRTSKPEVKRIKKKKSKGAILALVSVVVIAILIGAVIRNSNKIVISEVQIKSDLMGLEEPILVEGMNISFDDVTRFRNFEIQKEDKTGDIIKSYIRFNYQDEFFLAYFDLIVEYVDFEGSYQIRNIKAPTDEAAPTILKIEDEFLGAMVYMHHVEHYSAEEGMLYDVELEKVEKSETDKSYKVYYTIHYDGEFYGSETAQTAYIEYEDERGELSWRVTNTYFDTFSFSEVEEVDEEQLKKLLTGLTIYEAYGSNDNLFFSDSRNRLKIEDEAEIKGVEIVSQQVSEDYVTNTVQINLSLEKENEKINGSLNIVLENKIDKTNLVNESPWELPDQMYLNNSNIGIEVLTLFKRETIEPLVVSDEQVWQDILLVDRHATGNGVFTDMVLVSADDMQYLHVMGIEYEENATHAYVYMDLLANVELYWGGGSEYRLGFEYDNLDEYKEKDYHITRLEYLFKDGKWEVEDDTTFYFQELEDDEIQAMTNL